MLKRYFGIFTFIALCTLLIGFIPVTEYHQSLGWGDVLLASAVSLSAVFALFRLHFLHLWRICILIVDKLVNKIFHISGIVGKAMGILLLKVGWDFKRVGGPGFAPFII